MKIILGFLLAVVLAWVNASQAQSLQWALEPSVAGEETVSIRYREDGEYVDFAEALAAAASNKQIITSISLGRLAQLPDRRLQSQVFGFLAANHRELLTNALSTKGADHAIALKALRPGVEEALLASSIVRSLNWMLQSVGMHITGVSMEKFYLFNNDEFPNFDALTWLVVEPQVAP